MFTAVMPLPVICRLQSWLEGYTLKYATGCLILEENTSHLWHQKQHLTKTAEPLHQVHVKGSTSEHSL